MGGLRPQLIGDIGFGELVVIAFVAVLVFGPDKLPVLAKQAGAMARKLRDFANSARDELRTELGEEYADLELRDLDPRTIVRKHIVEAMEAGDEDETPTRRRGQRPLADGEVPPYDAEST
jgi:sec-independent protein translocase protein TatB